VQYALLAAVGAAASLMGKLTISTALQNALSTMSLLERAIAP
jgi:Flp pilus assembly pilin Flp